MARAVKKALLTWAVPATAVAAAFVAGTFIVGVAVGSGRGVAVAVALGKGTGVTVGKSGFGVIVGKEVGSGAGGEGVTTIVTAGRVLVGSGVWLTATTVAVGRKLFELLAERAKKARKATSKIITAGIKTSAIRVGLLCLDHQLGGGDGGPS